MISAGVAVNQRSGGDIIPGTLDWCNIQSSPSSYVYAWSQIKNISQTITLSIVYSALPSTRIMYKIYQDHPPFLSCEPQAENPVSKGFAGIDSGNPIFVNSEDYLAFAVFSEEETPISFEVFIYNSTNGGSLVDGFIAQIVE